MIDLDAIRARRAAITPGTWTTEGKRSDYNADYIWYRTEDAIGQICRITGAGTDADAAFIAAAPADIDALLAEVERLQAENTWLHSIVAVTRGYKADAGEYPPRNEPWRGMTLNVREPKPPPED